MKSPFSRHLTAWSLIGLLLGLALGAWGQASGGRVVPTILALLQPLGALWVNALQALVLPLVFANVLSAIVGRGGSDRASIGRLGVGAVMLFVVMLVAAGLFTAVATPPLLSLYEVDTELVTKIGDVEVPAAAREANAGRDSIGDWISGLLPGNLFEAAAGGQLLPLMLFAILFGLAVNTLPATQRDPLAHAIEGGAAAMLTAVGWVLLATPLAVFAFMLATAHEMGGSAAGLLGVFIVLQCLLMLAVTGLLYPLTAVIGRVSLPAFARALAPAQVVAVSTRSSIASLPAMVHGAREHLPLPDVATGFVLPLSSSLFKLNRTVSSTVKVLFLAHIYGITLTPLTLATFIATIILLSFTAVGVPGGGRAFQSVPAYLAAGIPLPGVIILEAADTIPDIFKTLLNVTGQMSAATVLTRGRAALAE